VSAAERGSAAVLVTALFGVLVVVTGLVAAVGGVVTGQRRVEAAADLAALAGASAAQAGRDPCAAATSIARRNGGLLSGCAVHGEVVTVVVHRDSRPMFGRSLTLAGRARAGPVR
jgi:secretion/DNA translocation related TadE-like protein